MIIYKEFEPSDILAEFIKCFWVLERTYDGETPCENILPDSYIEFILNFGVPYYLKDKGDLPFAFMVGLLKQPLPAYADGTVKLLCVRFYPWGLLSFFDIRLEQNINTDFTFDLPEELKTKLNEFAQKQEYENAIGQLQNFFLEKYLTANFDKQTVSAAAQVLYRERGECRIEDLARMCFTTQRTLERNFNDKLGLSPKSYASNVRFDKAKKKLTHDPFIDLTALAQDSGYYDQAHFIKDFKTYCGCTPSEFAEGIKRMSKTFTDRRNVVFLQSRD
ncbi:MAG TPA: helix-turn-helix domain-containing protein [Pyrinomonadaceae bacterium]|jgi:AraC-like DNA-binding protein|nr:helix-turn-helix domain-containing protein [Pyrinomonadaceae bacterium]